MVNPHKCFKPTEQAPKSCIIVYALSGSLDDKESQTKITNLPSGSNSNPRQLIVDLTHDNEDEDQNSGVKDQEDSDYQMALMLSQQEINTTSKEEKLRMDREKADYQMALKLTQEENFNFFPPDECENKVVLSTNADCREKSAETNVEIPINLDPSGLMTSDYNEIGAMHEKASMATTKYTNTNDNPSSLPHNSNDELKSDYLNHIEEDSLIWRDQSEDYSFTTSVIVTPPPSEISSKACQKKRKNTNKGTQGKNKLKKVNSEKGNINNVIELASKNIPEKVYENEISRDTPPRSSHADLCQSDPIYNRPTHSMSRLESSDEEGIHKSTQSIRHESTSLRETSSTSTPEASTPRKKLCKKRKTDNDASSSCSNKEGSRRKKYIPKPGSGGYAILIALFYNESCPSYKGYLTKDELIDASQPFANASMRFSQPGDKFSYCGYTSSSILKKKDLITKSKNPVQIRLEKKNLIKLNISYFQF